MYYKNYDMKKNGNTKTRGQLRACKDKIWSCCFPSRLGGLSYKCFIICPLNPKF